MSFGNLNPFGGIDASTALNVIAAMGPASAENNGFLLATDWIIFNAKEPAIGTKLSAFNKAFGILAGTVAEGNDSRIINGQTAYGWGDHAGLYSLVNHNHTLDSLSNVTISSNSSGEVLVWSGSAWVNNTLSEVGIFRLDQTSPQSIINGAPTFAAGLKSTGDITFNVGANRTITICAQTVANQGQSLLVKAGAGFGSPGYGGQLSLFGGDSATGGAGARVLLGGGGTGVGQADIVAGTGADVYVRGADNSTLPGNSAGGDIYLIGGANSGTSKPGAIKIMSRVNAYVYASLDTLLLQADRVYQFPDKAGTFMMTSDFVPAGNNTEVQFNNNGVFGSSIDLTFANNTLTIGTVSGGHSTGYLRLANTAAGYYNEFHSSDSQAANVSYIFPVNKPGTGLNGFMKSDDAGIMTWDTGTYLSLDQTSPQTILNGIPLLDPNHAAFNLDHQIIDKEYADSLAGGGMKSWFFTKTASDIGGMYKATLTLPPGSVQTITATAADGETVIASFLTELQTSQYRVTEGSRFFYITAKTSSTSKPQTLRGYVYSTDVNGANPVLLRTTNLSKTLTDVDALYSMNAWGESLVIPTTTRIKFVIAVIKTGTGANPTVTISVEDDTYSRLDVPSPVGVTDLSGVLHLDQTVSQTILVGQPIWDTLTASQLVATDANKKFQSLAVATYPSLTELSYVKGVTSAIQTQFTGKLSTTGGTLTGNLLFSTDNTLDIGANGATRPRTGYFGTSVIAPNFTGVASKATNLVGGNSTTLLGSIGYQSNTDTTSLLSPNTTTTKKYLVETGTGTNGAAPIWDTILAVDVAPTLNDAWWQSYDYAGNIFSVVKISKDNLITFGGQLDLNHFYHVTNAGVNNIVDIPITAASPDLTEHGVRIKLGTNSVFKISTLSDGVGGIKSTNTSVLVGNFTITAGHVLFTADNTYDIGAVAATRPRTGYFGTSVVAPNFTGTASKATNMIGGNSTTLLGSIGYQSNTDTTTLLSPNTTTTKKWLSQTGTGTNGAIPAWSSILMSDVSLLNNTWITTLDYAGNTANLIKLSSDNLIEFGAPVGINSLYHVINPGLNDIVNIYVDSISTIGTEHGVGVTIAGIQLMKISALSDGAGSITDQLVKWNCGKIEKLVTVTDTYQALSSDYTIVCNKATAFTVTLPVAVIGQILYIKNINTGVVTVDGLSTDTIDDATTVDLAQWESLTVQCNLANKWIIL